MLPLSERFGMPTTPTYEYTTLGSLPDSGRVNIYGVVQDVTVLENGGFIVQIEDEESSAIVRFVESSATFAKSLQVGDILRVHRTEVGSYQNGRALIVKVGTCGCHAVVWRGQRDAPQQITSISCTVSKDDVVRLHALRRWLASKVTSVRPLPNEPRTSSNGAPEVSNQELAVSSVKKTAPACLTISSAEEIPDLWSKFFNWYAQVLGVYKGKGDTLTVFLRVWDGTIPRFPAYRNMFRAGSDSIETTYCEIQQTLFPRIEEYLVDVCCYGDWARKATEFEVGDIVYLGNIRNYVSQSNKISAVTLHDGGGRFNRALNVLNESDPNYFRISKQCADTLSLHFGPNSSLLSSPTYGRSTPIVPEEVQDHSTPKATRNLRNEVTDEQSVLVEESDVSNRRITNGEQACDVLPTDFSIEESIDVVHSSSAAANVSSPSNTSIVAETLELLESRTSVDTETSSRKRPRSVIDDGDLVTNEQVADAEEFSEAPDARQGPSGAATNITQPILCNNGSNGIVESGFTIVDHHIKEICEDSAFHMEIIRFLDDLIRLDLPEYEEMLRIMTFKEKFNQKLLKAFESKVAELGGEEAGNPEIAEDMERILSMNVGDHVTFDSFVKADLSAFEQPDYLRNALLFTGKCKSCSEEVILERCSKNWCPKCYTERNKLSAIEYSYRILIPSVYRCRDGQFAQLCLAVDGYIWASLTTEGDQLSVKKVMELYSEEVFETYIRKLNDVILLAKGIMKKKKFSVIAGKIIALNRSDGSISIFVDRCFIRDC
ncbi:3-ketoacyl-CoA thiolase with broad chain length specificity [Parelaphostrongylus tenuis]|uniref:3-ketoacyl-CoA thiolase with broad chain length specificity n=1 Tax=Parelaphostrongylus tenuis TaxID=148309 RepID=A0AAD5WKN9_PARTN|nr:3-ketoacyl-CoA thiolase with broad chain length specificity [Parelaphostrongylus tenuis]